MKRIGLQKLIYSFIGNQLFSIDINSFNQPILRFVKDNNDPNS